MILNKINCPEEYKKDWVEIEKAMFGLGVIISAQNKKLNQTTVNSPGFIFSKGEITAFVLEDGIMKPISSSLSKFGLLAYGFIEDRLKNVIPAFIKYLTSGSISEEFIVLSKEFPLNVGVGFIGDCAPCENLAAILGAYCDRVEDIPEWFSLALKKQDPLSKNVFKK